MRRVLMWLVVASSAACFGDDPTGSSTITASYSLRTINGSPLPYTIVVSATTKRDVLDDVITLHQGGTFAESARSRTTVNGQVTTETNTKTGIYGVLRTAVSIATMTAGRSRWPPSAARR